MHSLLAIRIDISMVCLELPKCGNNLQRCHPIGQEAKKAAVD
jgi:hypothetical protein